MVLMNKLYLQYIYKYCIKCHTITPPTQLAKYQNQTEISVPYTHYLVTPLFSTGWLQMIII